MAVIFDKNEKSRSLSTPILPPLITVDIYEDKGIIVDGEPFTFYIKSIGFRNQEEYEHFKIANGINN